jgi:hypothetical protein
MVNDVNPEQRRVLLAEYQACQSESESIGSQYWPSIGIITGINIIFLTGIIHGTISGSRTVHDNIFWLFMGLAISIITSLFLCCLLKRNRYLNQLYLFRMREIENILGMWKNRTVDYIDNSTNQKEIKYANEKDRLWCTISDAEKKRIDKIKERYKPTTPGHKLEIFLFILFNLPWVVLLIFASIDC